MFTEGGSGQPAAPCPAEALALSSTGPYPSSGPSRADLARRRVKGSRAFVRGEKRLRKTRPGNDPIFYHFKEAFVGFAESQKEEHQFNPITSFPWCCVAKIKIKPPLFNGQKAKPCNLPFRRRQWCTPVSGTGAGGRAPKAGVNVEGKGTVTS